MKIIAFVGLPLSGKTTASRIAEEMGIPVVVMGDVVREEVLRRGLELTDENAGRVATELREKEGMDAIAKRCIPRIREKLEERGIVVVDGIRGIAEVETFRKEFGDDFILINVEAPLEVRFERALKRKREDDVKTPEELKRRDERELSWSMREAIKIADITVENTGTIDEFEDKIRAILTHFLPRVEVEIETDVFPTEDEEKVKKAVKNLFPDATIEIEDGKLYARTSSLSRFRELLRMQRILDTARSELIRGRSGNRVKVLLNKQTAFVSRINFAEEDAILSPLRVTFRLYDIDFERFLDYMAPETRDGRPIRELERL
ncbi:AAA family ATPase [Geoglobus acetivorans]|uniref:Multifunctional fusion protein n=1 Tax=Geoglobus acetivorans TaxID=565033 RepID=A0ABZ3H0V6_GEOAI|nr:flagellar hook-basal body complex protein FliE [Geoglobus acetivorans]